MPRVQSKNLFHFRPKGEVDADIQEMEANMEKQFGEAGAEIQQKMKDLALKEDEESTKEFVTNMRNMGDAMLKGMFQHPDFTKSLDEITETQFGVPTTHHGEYDVRVWVYTPKKLQENSKNAAYIYAHGGGAVAFSADLFKPGLALFAVDCNVVVFNVDYRLAPETKCPNNVKDFYEVIKHIVKNADELGVDAAKIAIGGDSGGGYLCLGAEVMLAQNDETDLVKLALPGIPMVDDYCFSDPAAMTVEERKDHMTMRKIWKLIAADFDKQKDDPLLFPGKASPEILAKMPATIIVEAEFDMFITEATRMAAKLRAAGRLLEFIVVPGAKHGSSMMPQFECFKIGGEAMKLAFQEYLHN